MKIKGRSLFKFVIFSYTCFRFRNNIFSSKTLKCESDVGSRYGRENINDIENDINNKNNEGELDIPDLPFEMMDEDSYQEMQTILENPDANPELYREIMASRSGYQPPSFKQFNQSFKSHDDEAWNGLKLSGVYSPIQSFKFDTDITIEPNSRSSRFSFVSMNQSKSDPNKSLVIVGRHDPSFVSSLQFHGAVTPKDKITLVTNFKQTDPNQSMWELEYNKVLDRLNLTAKYSNQGASFVICANAYKNLHLGMETNIHPKTGDVMYSYGIHHKPHKKIGYAIMYLSYVPMISFDMLYIHNRFLRFFLSISKNYNPMIMMTGQSPNEIKLSGEYKLNNGSVSVGINQSMGLSTSYVYNYSKNLNFSLVSEIIIPNAIRRRKAFKAFGVGVTYTHETISTLNDVEEDVSEYEYKNL
jgi:hypothetical protein